MAYQRPFEGADKAIPDAYRKVDEPTNTRKDQKAENTGIRVEKFTIIPGHFGAYVHAPISPVLPPRSTMFEWHKERRRTPATIEKVLIEELQKMRIAKVLEAPKRSAFNSQPSILNGRLQQKFPAQKLHAISEMDRKSFDIRWAGYIWAADAEKL
ncbi:uncharacterized protein EAF02_000898 [Botrytis sinoallii]|uniref:uncharacterized protein n=1 Tax=Botrytis sinoallii TaxID=1463999 RepID=UPI0018FFBE56|nr:uncharacterized protein EAF02_000898 [Botrytis sinoallii]KAF7893360.1 hypothetical protein EAF02_000898 [Botrytis sinoallii]